MMLLIFLAFAGGVLTILSPCILPVLPFVFARAGLPFRRAGLPMLAGMAFSFAAIATLAAVAGNWVVAAHEVGRWLAMGIMVVLGATLLFPAWAVRLTAPLVVLGGRLSQTQHTGVWGSVLLGGATGLLWAPCAGPILGLILTGAALNGPNLNTSLLLFAYAAGAATSLGLALLAGGRIFATLKRGVNAGAWLRRGAGALVLLAVSAIAAGVDKGLLTQLSLASTTAVEERLIAGLDPARAAPPAAMMMRPQPDAPTGGNPAMMVSNPTMVQENSAMMAVNPAVMQQTGSMMTMNGMVAAAAGDAAVAVQAPPLDGITHWFNSPALTQADLKGKVVLIDFWTYSCINCVRAIPYVRAWAEKYRAQGLVVIGVHTPEFAFERNLHNVQRAITAQKILYPVAVDNQYAVWRAFNNRYWPAHYFIDAEGRMRHQHFGEGGYAQSERVIQQLLREAGQTRVAEDVVAISAHGAEIAADFTNVLSPETYIGFIRAENFVSPGGIARNVEKEYTSGNPRLNEWGLTGAWQVHDEYARLAGAQGSVTFRFHARDLHMVLAPGADGKPVRFRVTLDGAPPGAAHGEDTDAQGQGRVTQERLYQLIRQADQVGERQFEIQFLEPGVQAYVFTFG